MKSNVIRINWAAEDAGATCVSWRTLSSRFSMASEIATAPLPDRAVTLDDFLDSFLAEPQIAQHVAAASAALARDLQPEGGPTLRTLRLAVGMSQADLAAAIGSSQSRVSRLEALQEDASAPVLRRLSDALKVDFNTLMDAMTRAGN